VGLFGNTQYDFGDTICIDPKLHASEQFGAGDDGFYCGGFLHGCSSLWAKNWPLSANTNWWGSS
jgi:hypothetical protein